MSAPTPLCLLRAFSAIWLLDPALSQHYSHLTSDARWIPRRSAMRVHDAAPLGPDPAPWRKRPHLATTFHLTRVTGETWYQRRILPFLVYALTLLVPSGKTPSPGIEMPTSLPWLAPFYLLPSRAPNLVPHLPSVTFLPRGRCLSCYSIQPPSLAMLDAFCDGAHSCLERPRVFD